MRIFYDTEFLEIGPVAPIQLISVGMVREDGAELYCLNAEFNPDVLQYHPWHMENTVPLLPIREVPTGNRASGKKLIWDKDDPIYDDHAWTREGIRDAVSSFIGDKPELWAWYGAYDHVVFAQLWGTMSQMPRHIPFYTNDLRQWHVSMGKPELPAQCAHQHHALADARWNAKAWQTLHDQQVALQKARLVAEYWRGHDAAEVEHRASCKQGTCDHSAA